MTTNEHFFELPTCSILNTFLAERIEHPENAEAIDKKIIETFEKTVAIFVLDMSGFSRLVQRYGIIHYLAMIQRMRQVVGPAVEKAGGHVVKFEADNCFAVFPHPNHAIEATKQIYHDLKIVNDVTPDESDVHVSIGIGYGPILLGCDDMFGNEMNLASKLGEDVAEKDEVLLTEEAKKACTLDVVTTEIPLTVSGVNMKSYRLETSEPTTV